MYVVKLLLCTVDLLGLREVGKTARLPVAHVILMKSKGLYVVNAILLPAPLDMLTAVGTRVLLNVFLSRCGGASLISWCWGYLSCGVVICCLQW